jgi:hypothetical protein
LFLHTSTHLLETGTRRAQFKVARPIAEWPQGGGGLDHVPLAKTRRPTRKGKARVRQKTRHDIGIRNLVGRLPSAAVMLAPTKIAANTIVPKLGDLLKNALAVQ